MTQGPVAVCTRMHYQCRCHPRQSRADSTSLHDRQVSGTLHAVHIQATALNRMKSPRARQANQTRVPGVVWSPILQYPQGCSVRHKDIWCITATACQNASRLQPLLPSLLIRVLRSLQVAAPPPWLLQEQKVCNRLAKVFLIHSPEKLRALMQQSMQRAPHTNIQDSKPALQHSNTMAPM